MGQLTATAACSKSATYLASGYELVRIDGMRGGQSMAAQERDRIVTLGA